MINNVTLCGNVGKDPKITTFNDGGKVAQFSLATTEKGFKTKDGRDIPDRTQWHNIVINRSGLAEVAEKNIRKGDKVMLLGEIRYRNYTAEGGEERSITEIYVNHFELCGKFEKREQAPAPAPDGAKSVDAGREIAETKGNDDLQF